MNLLSQSQETNPLKYHLLLRRRCLISLKKIPSSKAIGCDGLKLAASVLVHPLCDLMIFPSLLDVSPRHGKPLKLLLCLKVALVKTQATMDQFLYYLFFRRSLNDTLLHLSANTCTAMICYTTSSQLFVQIIPRKRH